MGSALAIIAALGLGLGIVYFPQQSEVTQSTTLSTSQDAEPGLLTGELFARNSSCSLETGVCSFTIVNNSTVPLEFEACYIEVILNSDGTLYGEFNGTMGGTATSGIPANSQVNATCAISTTHLTYETKGGFADIGFTIKTLQAWNGGEIPFPAGSETTTGEVTTWS